MEKCKLTLVRVPYGKKDIPIEIREYHVVEFHTTAVGTISEIRDFVKESMGCEAEFHIIDTISGI